MAHWKLANNNLALDLRANDDSTLSGTIVYNKNNYDVRGAWFAEKRETRGYSAFALSGYTNAKAPLCIGAAGRVIGSGAAPTQIHISGVISSSNDGTVEPFDETVVPAGAPNTGEDKERTREIEMKLTEVYGAYSTKTVGLCIERPDVTSAMVHDQIKWHFSSRVPYAQTGTLTIDFMVPQFEEGDSNVPGNCPFENESAKTLTAPIRNGQATVESPPIISKPRGKSREAQRSLPSRYTYTARVEIPFDENSDFPPGLLAEHKESGIYRFTDDPELYVDEC